MTKKKEKAKELRDMALAYRKEGKVMMWVLPEQLMTAQVAEFVRQPVDGILWDLNRGEECADFSNIRGVNDFAVAVTIRELVKQRDAAEQALRDASTSRDDMDGEGVKK